MLKRYIAFIFMLYDDPPGWACVLKEEDGHTVRSWDTAEEATATTKEEMAKHSDPDYGYEIINLHTGEVVSSGSKI